MKKIAVYGLLATLFACSTTLGQVDGKRKGRDGRPQNAAMLGRMMQALDKNKDGKLSQDEAPERMKERFAQIDGNKDGFVDTDELQAAFARRMRGGQPGPGNASGGKGKKGSSDAKGRPGQRPGQPGRGLDLAALFKAGDKDGDGNLNPEEQQAIIAKVNQMMERFRKMRGGDGKQKGASDRFGRPNTDPVKPKRPGMKD